MNIAEQIKSLKHGEVIKFKIEGVFFEVSMTDSCGNFYFLSCQSGPLLKWLEINSFLADFYSCVLKTVFKYQEDLKTVDVNAPFNPDEF